MLGVHHRGELAHDQLRHRGQVALPLEHSRDARQVGLQPVLLGVPLRRLAQVGDHLVDVVLELGDLALSLDRDRPGQVALSHRGRHLGDRAELGGQRDRQLIDVLGQPPPRSGHALDLGLAAELALGADLAGDAGDLGGEARQLRDHPVQRLLELEDLAAGVDGDRLRHVAVRHRGRHLGDVADLVGQVARHEVDVVGQVLPGARRRPGPAAWPPRLPSVPTSRATRVTSAANERSWSTMRLIVSASAATSPLASTVIFWLRSPLATAVVTLGDVADLGGEVRRHQVHVLGQALPRAGHALDLGLTAEIALGADLARDAGHLGRERAELVDHRVDRVLELEDLALGVDRDLLGEVALGHRGGHLGDVSHLVGQVRGHEVHVLGEALPGAGHALDLGLAAELAVGADLAGDAGHLVGERATAGRPSC